MAFFLEIPPVSDLWPGSSFSAPAAGSTGILSGDGVIPLIIAGLIVLCLCFSRSILYAVSGSVTILFTNGRRSDLSDGISFRKASVITFLLCIPIAAVSLVLAGASRRSLLTTAAVTTGFALLQLLLRQLVKSFGQSKSYSAVSGLGRGVFILATIALLPAAIIGAAASGTGGNLAPVLSAIVFSIAALLYISASFKTIISMGFSYFFTFLYLCSLQLLPLAAAVKFLLE